MFTTRARFRLENNSNGKKVCDKLKVFTGLNCESQEGMKIWLCDFIISHTQKDPIYWNIVLIYFDCDINDNSLDILTRETLRAI